MASKHKVPDTETKEDSEKISESNHFHGEVQHLLPKIISQPSYANDTPQVQLTSGMIINIKISHLKLISDNDSIITRH